MPKKPTAPRTTPATEIAVETQPAQWFSTSMIGLMPGTNLVPFTGDSIYLASSAAAATAFWGHTNRFLAYYRVQPEGEPMAVDSVPGVYRCDRAMITQELGRSATRRATGPGLGRHHAA